MKERAVSLLLVLLCTVLLGVPLGGWKLFSSDVPEEPSEPREYGASFDVPGFRWVEVMNDRGVRTGTHHLGKYQYCLLRYRGTVTTITNHESFYTWATGETLAEYEAPGSLMPTGVLCPTGTLFFTQEADLEAFQMRYDDRVAMEDGLKGRVTELARNFAPEAPALVEDTFHWVEIVNPGGVRTVGHEVEFLDTCGIESGGVQAWLGETDQGDVFSYSPPQEAGLPDLGIPCPTDTLFLFADDTTRYF